MSFLEASEEALPRLCPGFAVELLKAFDRFLRLFRSFFYRF